MFLLLQDSSTLRPMVENQEAMELVISEAIGLVGSIAAVAVGGYVAFMIVRRGLNWLNTALRGESGPMSYADDWEFGGEPEDYCDYEPGGPVDSLPEITDGDVTLVNFDGTKTVYRGAYATTYEADGSESVEQYRGFTEEEKFEMFGGPDPWVDDFEQYGAYDAKVINSDGSVSIYAGPTLRTYEVDGTETFTQFRDLTDDEVDERDREMGGEF